LVIGFNELLQNIVTNNYTANTNSHTLQFTTSFNKAFSVCCIFTSCCLVMASNTIASSASVFTSLLAGDFLTSNSYSSNCRLKTLNCSCCWLYNLSMDRIENTSPNSFFIVASCSYRMNCVENSTSQLLHCCVCCLALGICAKLLSNAWLSWLHSSCFD
jgi:hypothetical protein